MVHWLKMFVVLMQQQQAGSATEADGLRAGLKEAKEQTKSVETRLERVQAAKEEATQVVSAGRIITSCTSHVCSCIHSL